MDMPLEIFYGSLEEPLTRKEAAMARLICQACPVRRDCLISAMKRTEEHGVWAGLSPMERNIAMKKAQGDWRRAVDVIAADLEIPVDVEELD